MNTKECSRITKSQCFRI